MVGLAALIGLGIALLFVFNSDSDDSGGPSPTAALSRTADGKALESVVEKGQDLTYHARYRVGGAQPTGGSIEVQLWRKGDRIRLDQELRSAGRTVRTAGFRLEDRMINCVREGEDPWRCTQIDPSQLGGGNSSADPLIGGLVAELSTTDMTITSEEVAGEKVRCFKNEDSTRQVCLTDEGIAVRIGTSEARLELVKIEREVDDKTFDLPAEPTQPGG